MPRRPFLSMRKLVCCAAALALSAPGLSALQAPAQGATANVCDPSPEFTNLRTSSARCINGTLVRSRGYNGCLMSKRGPERMVYQRNECYGNEGSENTYIESIAQARLVQWYNYDLADRYPGEGVDPYEDGDPAKREEAEVNQWSGVVTSAIQWELRTTRADGAGDVVAGGRADVVMVDEDWEHPDTNLVEVIEIKQGEEGSSAIGQAFEQADGYVTAMQLNLGWSNARGSGD